ncbi:MAG: hypothetical protein KAJ30_08155 [Candidatus Heimdallarchaeota archaeon]|nr:hypothetical protein [Candidatus Heimdallarchaeota archaeon]
MANEIFLKLITSEFTGDEAKQVEYSSIVGYALDNIKRKEILEGVYTCYVPFYAVKISDGNYIVINTLQLEKNKLLVSKIPDLSEIRTVLDKEYSSLDAHYRAIEETLVSMNIFHLEISGVLVKKGIEGTAKLVTQHGSTRNNSYKKISPLVSRDDVKREIAAAGKYAITDHELETKLNVLLDEVEKHLQLVVENKKRDRVKIEQKYDQQIENQKQENAKKIHQFKEEEKQQHNSIESESNREKRDQITSVKDSKRWNQLKKDIASQQESYNQLLTSLDRVTSEDDFDIIISRIREVQDETQSFGVGLNSAVSEIEYRKTEYEDIGHQEDVDKRNVSDRLNTAKEDLNLHVVDIQDEKRKELEVQDKDIQKANNILDKFKTNRNNLIKRAKNNYVMISAYSLSSDLLGISDSEQLVTINVPVAICKYKDKSGFIFNVIPPVEIANNMKKPRNLALHGANGLIGFDCIAKESFNFLKDPLENLLASKQNLQAEIQTENNEMIQTGDLSSLNSGLVLLEQRKKYSKKNADSILARSRSFLS